MKLQLLLLSVNIINFCLAERQRFDHYKVYRVNPTNANQLAGLQYLDGNSKDALVLNNVHMGPTDFFVAPSYLNTFLNILKGLDLTPELIDNNAQTSLSLDIEPVADANRRSDDYLWSEYHELNDTHHWMQNLVAKYPGIVSMFVVGRSFEGRELLGLRINHINLRLGKQSIFLEAGMHAREWISPATATYFINELLTSKQPEIMSLARSYVWYILPHANPDGYVHTHKTNRMWRKTRSRLGNNCIGTDPNRNWDFHWREVGASSDPCSESYAGPRAFSEPEVEALAQYLRKLPEPMFMYLSLHSFSQLLLYPYGHTSQLPENHRNLRKVFNAAVRAIEKRYGTRYTGGNVYDAIYPAAGSSTDWVYGVLNVKYSYCYELRPSGYSFWTGFRLPASQIIPTGKETTDALVEMIKAAAQIEGYKIH
ncbi:zinc carboxypeptidase [Drosophila ficusphila]|uniref:zinc carboxypeptidase n=1 Tax=Drosophila ficusphila TaxID=30025 RepID=UPI0007E5F216|nr:zinc carboxypeptidase [Drosophila ficusphila]